MAREPSVDRRITQARRQADERVARNARTSRTRLKTLLKLPPAERLAHLDDADLKSEDRTVLRRSLGRHLPLSRWRLRRFWPRRRRIRRWISRVLMGLFTFEISVPVALLLAWAIMAWHNTTHWMLLTQVVLFDVDGPDGAVQHYEVRPGKTLVRYGWDGVPRTTLNLQDGRPITLALPTESLGARL